MTSASISGGFLAGCLLSSDLMGVGEDDPDADGDVDDMSIDGQLHNGSGEPQTFMVTIRNVDGEEVTSDEWEDGAGETKPVSAVGKPNESRTFEVTVKGVTETLEFDVEAEPGKRAGYVEITYTQDGTVEVVFTPASDGGLVWRVWRNRCMRSRSRSAVVVVMETRCGSVRIWMRSRRWRSTRWRPVRWSLRMRALRLMRRMRVIGSSTRRC